MTEPTSRRPWLPTVSTLLSVLACYGTLIIVAALGAMGIVVAINETIWASAIVVFAGLAVFGLFVSYRSHRSPLPMIIALIGLIVTVYTMYFHYNRILELGGFVLLTIAVMLDWRRRKHHDTSLMRR